MIVTPTDIPDVVLLEPRVFRDGRGLFFESWNEQCFRDLLPSAGPFVQDNHSRSQQGVLRGMHYQISHAQGKLVRVVSGRVYDVAVDMRRSSPTFGRWTGHELSDQNLRMLWIPPGFAHGFLVLSASADFLYKATDYYSPADERTLAWNDLTVAVNWPEVEGGPRLSTKDQAGMLLQEAESYL